jgi:FkbM family methyltransferase
MTKEFSQSGEEPMILEWAERHGPGRFLDVGAADGVTASNSRALALAGWSGVCVEPAALLFDKLSFTYAANDDVHCVQAALVPELTDRLVPFYMSHDLVSTTVERNAQVWADLVEFVPSFVAAVTVDELLAAFPGPYDFLSIDTEGSSLAIWDALRARGDVFAPNAMAVVEAENGGERWLVQSAAHERWARVGVTPNNVLLERL